MTAPLRRAPRAVPGEGAAARDVAVPAQTRLERWGDAPLVPLVVRALTLVLGALTAWRFRYQINPDTIAYMDVSDQFLRHGLADPHVGYWSPLYPMVIAAFRALLGSGPEHEWPIVHAANFAIFLAAFAAYEYLLRTIAWWADTEPTSHVAPSVDAAAPARHTMLFATGHLLFLWATIGMIGLGVFGADMLVAGCVFAAAALTLRLRGTPRWRYAIALGAVFGLAYLAKAVMFPGSLLFIAALAFGMRRSRPARVLAVLVAFAVVAAPEVIAVSRIKGAPTFGESGRLNYAWFVGLVPTPYWYAANLRPPLGMTRPAYLDPVRGVAVDSAHGDPPKPILYNADRPYPGTAPIWYDPVRWYPRDFTYHVPLRRELFVARTNLWLIVGWCVPLLLAMLVALVAWGAGPELGSLRVWWGLLLPSLAIVALYDLVYVERRYLAPFLVLAVLALAWAAFRTPPRGHWTLSDLFLRNVRNALYLAALLQAGVAVYDTVQQLRDEQVGSERALAIAAYVRQLVPPGTRVAVIGDPVQAYWARLTRSHVVAFVPSGQSQRFWLDADAPRAAILDSIRALRIPLVVADSSGMQFRTDTAGWTPIPGAPGALVRRL